MLIGLAVITYIPKHEAYASSVFEIDYVSKRTICQEKIIEFEFKSEIKRILINTMTKKNVNLLITLFVKGV